MILPTARGDLSAVLLSALVGSPASVDHVPVRVVDPLADDDLHLSLYLCYELHYRGLPGVDDRWEWNPSLLALRARLEGAFEQALRDAIREPVEPEHGEIDLALRAIETDDDGPSLSRYV